MYKLHFYDSTLMNDILLLRDVDSLDLEDHFQQSNKTDLRHGTIPVKNGTLFENYLNKDRMDFYRSFYAKDFTLLNYLSIY